MKSKIFCWYCGKEIKRRGFNDEAGLSFHHFFNHDDIKFRLIRIFGEPGSDIEHNQRQMLIHVIFTNMEKLPVHVGCHKIIEEKIV